MTNDKLRRQIIHEAARLMYAHQETGYYRAKLQAARKVCQGWAKPADLPSDREIRDEIQVLARLYGGATPEQPAMDAEETVDRFQVFQVLLAALEAVKQNPLYHPEGDALYHSLQVFELARDALPYDEEFLLAALLHDVGKAIDPRNHIAAALEALDHHITPRTAWLIEHHSEAGTLRDGTLGLRARKRLEASEDFDDLMLLCDCDRGGRQKGVQTMELEEALEHVRELSRSNGAS
jgi:predicted HD phosphohydrolase